MSTEQPPKVGDKVVHPSHLPEPPERRFFAHCTYCMHCCRLVDSTTRGVTDRGAAECPGPARVEMRATYERGDNVSDYGADMTRVRVGARVRMAHIDGGSVVGTVHRMDLPRFGVLAFADGAKALFHALNVMEIVADAPGVSDGPR